MQLTIMATMPSKYSGTFAPSSTKLTLVKYKAFTTRHGTKTRDWRSIPQSRVARILKNARHPKGDATVNDSSSISHLVISKSHFALIFFREVR